LKDNLTRHHLEAPQVRRRNGGEGPEIAKTLG
jgi:hypothetical protein